MSKQRFYQIGETQRKRILDRDNYLCVYCFETAEQVDHVIPYTYKAINVDWNLVACCHRCNNIASNMVFSSFIEKYLYIKRVRESKHVSRKSKRSICPDCGFQFIPLRNGATLLLCSDCTLLADLPIEERLRKVEVLKRVKQQQQKEQVEAVKIVAYEEVESPHSLVRPKPPTARRIIETLHSKRRPPKPNRPFSDNPYFDQTLDRLISDLRKRVAPTDTPLPRPSKEGREKLESLYIEYHGPLDGPGKMDNLQKLAATLSKAVERKSAWTARYLNNILNGYANFRVTEEMAQAMQIMVDKLDGKNPVQARSREIMVLTTNGIEPGSIVFGHTTRCYCQLPVVFNHPNRKYCFEECRQRAKQERKAKASI